VCIHSRFPVHRISTMASADCRDARAAIVAIAAGEIHHDDACDLVSVVARNKVIALAAGGDRKRCFSQRSWELMQRARASKEKKRQEQKRAALELELEDVWAALAIGDFQCGAIVASGQAAGVLSERDLSLLTLEAATSPTVRGSIDACERRRLLQDRSAAALVAFAEAAQGSFFLDVLSGGRATASESAPCAVGGAQRVHADFCTQVIAASSRGSVKRAVGAKSPETRFPQHPRQVPRSSLRSTGRPCPAPQHPN